METYDPLLPERRFLELLGRIGQFPRRDLNPQDIQLLLRTYASDFSVFDFKWFFLQKPVRPLKHGLHRLLAFSVRMVTPAFSVFGFNHFDLNCL